VANEVEKHRSRSGLVALGVTARQIPLVPPPQVDGVPVDGVAGRTGRDGREYGRADASAGEADAGPPGVGLPLDDGRDQSGRGGVGQVLRIRVADDLDGAHDPATR
jgi:hypothetical protein